jgi:CubicO group peptidase (beta-lactamase class C family)
VIISTATRLDDAILDAVSKFDVPGAQVAWLSDGSIQQVEAGRPRLDGRSAVEPDTRFRLGSVTKVFTATLAMQLVADGELSLELPIGHALPSGEVRTRLGEITLAQLLTHTSGLESDHPSGQTGFNSTREYVRALDGARLLFPPGQHFSYANAGYILIGHLIESVTDLSWAESVRSFLLDPLSVKGTFFLTDAPEGDLVADCHLRRGDRDVAAVTPLAPGRGLGPASGLAVSAADLLRLVRLHVDGGRAPSGCPMLPPSLVEEMRGGRVHVPDAGFAEAWGLGWALNRDGRGDVWFGHDGDDQGSVAYVRASVEHRFAIAMCANCLPARREWRLLMRALESAGVEVGDAMLPPPPPDPEPTDPSVAGAYENGAYGLTVLWDGGQLWLAPGLRERYLLRPLDRDRCLAVPDTAGAEPFLVAFLRDQEGSVRYLQTGGRIARRVPDEDDQIR